MEGLGVIEAITLAIECVDDRFGRGAGWAAAILLIALLFGGLALVIGMMLSSR